MSIIAAVNPDIERVQYECRFLRHSWDVFSPVGFAHSGLWRRAIHLRCPRCGTVRHDALDVHGELLTRKYEYPDEYKMDQDDRPTSDQLRLWMLKRNRAIVKLAKSR
jgi:hypothetical protein